MADEAMRSARHNCGRPLQRLASAGAAQGSSQLTDDQWWANVCYNRDEQQRLAKEAICDRLWVGAVDIDGGAQIQMATGNCRAQMQMATGTGKTHARRAVEDSGPAAPHTLQPRPAS